MNNLTSNFERNKVLSCLEFPYNKLPSKYPKYFHLGMCRISPNGSKSIKSVLHSKIY